MIMGTLTISLDEEMLQNVSYHQGLHWVRFFGFVGRKPVVVYNRRGTLLIWIRYVAAHPIGALLAYTDLSEFQPRHASGDACFAT